jgi:hypothetical protein
MIFFNDGNVIQRPRIEIILSNGERKYDILMLVDSGADTSFISSIISERLELKLSSAYISTSASGLFKVRHGKVKADIIHGKDIISTGEIPVTVPLVETNKSNFERSALLGRQGFFTKFNVTVEECAKRTVLNWA